MPAFSRRHFLQCIGGGAVLAASAQVHAAKGDFPDRPVSLVVPYPAGGASDAAARILGDSLSRVLGQMVTVDNYGGATGLIGSQKFLDLPADGYALLHGSINEVFLVPALNEAARYKPADFTLAAPLGEVNLVLLVRQGIPVDTLDAFLDYAGRRDKDTALTYATSGVDSLFHLMGEALAARLDLPLLHVPYKGVSAALQDLAGGQVDFALQAYQSRFEGMREQGRFKILSSFSTALPPPMRRIPLISQSRLIPDFEYTIGEGYYVRPQVPQDRVAVLRKALGEVLSAPDIRTRLESEGRTVAQPIDSQDAADRIFERQRRMVAALFERVGRKPLGG